MSEQSDTITIRVPKSLKEQLENTSKKNQVTLNNLINQVLYRIMNWDSQLYKMGWLQFEPSTVKQMMNCLTEKDMEEIAVSSKKGVSKAIEFLYGDTSVDHLAEFVDSWLTSANMPFRHTENTESHNFLVIHELGKNWSVFANKIVTGIAEDLGHTVIKYENKEDSYSTILKK
jgi:hypothetical protein